jgi:hypothetical protein
MQERITQIIKTVPANSAPEEAERRHRLGVNYSVFSDWHHWGPVGMWEYWTSDEVPPPERRTSGHLARSAAYFCLSESVIVVENYVAANGGVRLLRVR